ncbi:hypothetical protein DEA06_09980 [Microbacterium sp. Gd 4-13]|uniref:hypothetical protein n=1 Tax=Microbacterium sp. Gd 4-13 TaxID=2173179 RepID=UPI000D56819A|nr:hypothetical protein [Microbacterium sp. Gd 4-13]PVW04335.1 hypothetical protein DEA06_09980 [Microbacterium sp. Gd 4-13]
MSIPFDESDSLDATTGDDAALAATQDDTTLDDPTMNGEAVLAAAFDGEEVDDESAPERREDVPVSDLHLTDADQPVTQGDSPVEAALGEDGQGDLAAEDEVGAGLDDDGPDDLRTSV